MKPRQDKVAVLFFCVGAFLCIIARSQSLDQIGVTLLSEVTTNVDGTGIRVAQPEAGYDLGTNWEVNPGAVGQPGGLINYISANGSTTNFPNTLSSESGHADSVGGIFYGISGGVATNVANVDNYDANYFVQVRSILSNILVSLPSGNIDDPVVNQSFIFSDATTNEQQAMDSAYDNYAAQYNTLFVSAVGNGGPVNPPATCYNGIGVAAYGGSSSIGPTLDNGRAKPDITAPASETSFSTPQVSGAAALLIQAGLRGDGGGDTNSATDIQTIKALLLNGAVKPSDWTNNFPSPLDARYGAGVLNVFNSYEQLAGGKNGYIVSTSVTTNSPHPPTGDTGTVSVLSGWDFDTNSSSATTDGVNHYYFDVTNGIMFTATATLVWNRHRHETDINNLYLFLYDALSSNLVACSTSRVDNVEHLWLPQLPPSRYDLQVLKKGGVTVTAAEPYALAFAFASTTLNLTSSGTNVVLTWPVYPAGFSVAATTNLVPANWQELSNVPVVITNQQNWLQLNPTNASQFFRLQQP
jgi:hypothetical protein